MYALRSLRPADIALLGVGGTIALLIVIGIGWWWIARALPPVDTLAERVSSFRTTRFYDSSGALLHESFAPDAGLRTPVGLDSVSPWLVKATIATEDANFYEHRGVDPVAVARAAWYAVRERRVVSGASTIPQQLVRRVFLNPERKLSRKLREVVLAAEVSRRYGKDELLALYLNEIFYGNHAYGIAAAARTYFAVEAKDLSLVQAALLAGLPQAPSYHDPYVHPDRARVRRDVVLGLMLENGAIDRAQHDEAIATEIELAPPPRFDINAPHFTLTARERLEEIFGPEALTAMGLEVHTTLDSRLQAIAERAVADSVAEVAQLGASTGALVVIDPGSGAVRALVGSADFDNDSIAGQVNMAVSPRQPGSTMKPFAVLAGLEGRGLSAPMNPGDLLADIAAEWPDGAGGVYRPRNYDDGERGLVTMRSALANSYNIPMVRLLSRIGVESLRDMSRDLGITTLEGGDYGLSLVLGGGEVSLIEMTGAYAIFAAGGVRAAPMLIERVVGPDGEVLCQARTPTPCLPGADSGRIDRSQVIDAVDAFLVTDILSDNEARVPAFGRDSLLVLDRPAAVKTGTTNDNRDSWTIGYTPQFVAGAWVGNADNSQMSGVSGSTGAARVWNRFMREAHEGIAPTGFAVPPGIVRIEICSDTGSIPSEACPERRIESFAENRPPRPAEEDLWRVVRLDLESGMRADDAFPDCLVERRAFKVYPDEHRDWALAHGIEQPPADIAVVRAASVEIDSPDDNDSVSGILEVAGSADVPGFESFALWVGETASPRFFSGPVGATFGAPVVGGPLETIDVTDWEPGVYTLRLVVRDACGESKDARVLINVVAPTATATPSASPSPSVSPTLTPNPFATATPTLLVPGTAPTPAAGSSTPITKPTEGVPTATLAPRPTDPSAPTPPPFDTPVGEPTLAVRSTPPPAP